MAFSFTTALANLEVHLAAAAAAITPPIPDVGAGEPGVPTVATLRYWYEGDGDPGRMARNVLTAENIGERVTIRAYWPVSTRDKPAAAKLEARVRALKHEIKTRLLADSDLSESCEITLIGDAEAGWLLLDGGTWRTLTLPLTLDFPDAYPKAR